MRNLCINKHGLLIGVVIIRKNCIQQKNTIFPTAGNTEKYVLFVKSIPKNLLTKTNENQCAQWPALILVAGSNAQKFEWEEDCQTPV